MTVSSVAKSPPLLLLTASFIASALAVAWQWPATDPMVEGRPLSQWMREDFLKPTHEELLTADRLRSLGKPAVKWLTYTMKHGKSDPDEPGFFEKIRARIHPPPPISRMMTGYNAHSAAARNLAKLGDRSEGVIRVLTESLRRGNISAGYRDAHTLNSLGPATWPFVEENLVHGTDPVRYNLVATLWCRLDPWDGHPSETDVIKVYDLLARTFTDFDPDVRTAAVSTLSVCANYPISGAKVDHAAAALLPMVGDARSGAYNVSIRIVSYYRLHSEESIPRLVAMLKDEDPARQRLARWALEQLGVKVGD